MSVGSALLAALAILFLILVKAEGPSAQPQMLLPYHKAIDDLAAENRIKSEADARAYVDAFLDPFLSELAIDKALLPGVEAIKARLARAEFVAVQHPEKRIPEARVAEVFNLIMDEFGAPVWTRITAKEFHYFRDAVSLSNPNMISRLSDGELHLGCRPVEALWLLYNLEMNRGAPEGLKLLVAEGVLPSELMKRQPTQPERRLTLSGAAHPLLSDAREHAYRAALDKYLSSVAVTDIIKQANNMLTRLGVE